MKKRMTILLIYFILIVVMPFLMFLLTETRTENFWIALSFLVLSILLSGLITVFSPVKKSSAFPVEISIAVFSYLYVLIVLIINILFDRVFSLEYRAFLSIHIVCFGLFLIIELLMLVARSSICRQSNCLQPRFSTQQWLLFEAESVKLKLDGLPNGIKAESIKQMDAVCEKLRFSDFPSETDTADVENKIRSKLLSLSCEIDNLIEIQADDAESVNTAMNELKQLINERNLQLTAGNTDI